jgi:methyl-accepting chemotaxis protein
MRTFTRTSPGLPGFTLVLVVAWALIAVMMLTGTLVNARGIDTRVRTITGHVSGIDTDTGSVALAERTTRISGKILVAARPLATDLGQVTTSANSINRRVGTILSTAGSINRRAVGIGRTVGTIHSTVGSIHSTVRAIDQTVGSIHSRIERIGADVFSINASVDGIANDGRSILGSVGSIDRGVAAINRRAESVIGLARPIGSDLADVFVLVGRGPGGHTINAHANAIDCSRLINLVGRTSACGH